MPAKRSRFCTHTFSSTTPSWTSTPHVLLVAQDIWSQLKLLMRNPRLVGIRHIVQSESDDRFLLQPDFLRGISALEEFDLAYDILIYPKHLPAAVEFVRHWLGTWALPPNCR